MISHYSRSVNIVFKVAFWLVKIVSERINICSDVCLSLKFEQINKTEKKKKEKKTSEVLHSLVQFLRRYQVKTK